MKGSECKVSVQEDHHSFIEGQKTNSFLGYKKTAFLAAFLLILIALITTFIFLSFNKINELQQEVELLKSSIEEIQRKISEKYNDRDKNVPGILDFSNIAIDDYNDTDSNYEDYDADYDYHISADEYYDLLKSAAIKTGENFTKDAKKATASPRTKRNIIYSSDGSSLNSDDGSEIRNNFRKRHFSTQPSSSSNSYRYYPQTTPPPRQIHSGRIRFEHEHEHSQHVKRAGDYQNSEENPDVETVDLDQSNRRMRHHHLEIDESHRTGRMRPLPSAHFSGDTSKYVFGQHENFKGNGHLRHPEKKFVDWSESKWLSPLGMDRHFSLSDGLLTVKEPGLYFIYAQIYYYDEHDINGFRVYRNENETLLQCTTTSPSAEKNKRGNTCFTAGAEYLDENDRISLRDLESRYSVFQPGQSFFGVIKLGDVKIK